MLRRELLILAVVGVVAAPPSATAAPRAFELVHPRICLAGHWGKAQLEWRAQLGLFAKEPAAERYMAKLDEVGVKSESYIAMWRQQGDEEPQAVVTEAVLPDRKAARQLARELRRRGIPAFPRHYTRYVP